MTSLPDAVPHPLSESALRRSIPVFVNSCNQLTYLRDTLDWFARHGFGNVTVLDNASDYPPLLDYFSTRDFASKARLVRLGGNLGPRRSLERAASDPATDAGFIFTDPDLALPDPPAENLVTAMFEVGRRHGFVKVGLALSIDPEIVDVHRVTYNTRTVFQVERKYWKTAVEPDVFEAVTDTTFFLYVPRDGEDKRFNDYGRRQARIPSIRIAKEGFVAIHRPWLKHDPLPEAEVAHYAARAGAYSTYVNAQKVAAARSDPQDPPPEAASPRRGPARKAGSAFPSARQLLDTLIRTLDDWRGGEVNVLQVGANDGALDDPIRSFLAGSRWSGVLIEPHPVYFAELQALHAGNPRLTLVNVAASDRPGEIALHHLNEAARDRYPLAVRGCASLNQERIRAALHRAGRRRGFVVEEDDLAMTTVAVRRLDDILAELGIATTDLLVIDVEGHETQVLDGFDLAALRPTLAIIERNGLNRSDEATIAARAAAAGLAVFRLGDDLVGIREDALRIPATALLALLGQRRIA